MGVGSLTMCGTCCMCAAMFTFDGPRVLGSSCLPPGAVAGWTATKLKTSRRRQEDTRALSDTPLPSVVQPLPYRGGFAQGDGWNTQLEEDPLLYNGTFAGAHVLVNENLQLPVGLNQTGLRTETGQR